MSIELGMVFPIQVEDEPPSDFIVVGMFPLSSRDVVILEDPKNKEAMALYVEKDETDPSGLKFTEPPNEDIATIQAEYDRLYDEQDALVPGIPTIVITLEGGLVTNVMTECPANVIVVNYDVEGALPEEVTAVLGHEATVRRFKSEQHPHFSEITRL